MNWASASIGGTPCAAFEEATLCAGGCSAEEGVGLRPTKLSSSRSPALGLVPRVARIHEFDNCGNRKAPETRALALLGYSIYWGRLSILLAALRFKRAIRPILAG